LKLLDRLRELTSDDQEIYALLGSDFDGSRSSNSASGTEIFRSRDDEEPFYLELGYKGNRITSIKTGQKFSKAKQDALVDRASRALRDDVGTLVFSRYLFANLPLKSEFWFGSYLRLRPPPSDTVIGSDLDEREIMFRSTGIKRDSHLGPPFPFLMEVNIKKSSSHSLQSLWMSRTLDRMQNALTLLLVGDVRYAHLPSGPLWTLLFRNSQIENHLLQTGFGDLHGAQHEDFPHSKNPSSSLYEATDYYDRFWMEHDELPVPASLPKHLDMISSLDGEQALNFHRACLWFSQGVQYRQIETIGVPSFAAAIECLLGRSERSRPNCGQPADDGITRAFKRFIDRYGKLTPETAPLAERLYPARSELVHGSFAHASDTGWFSFKRDDDWQNMFAWIIARRCLIGWLEDEGRDS